jgi:hypothetical protein
MVNLPGNLSIVLVTLAGGRSAGSDSENDQLLGHLDARTLRKHYKRKPLKVRPLDMVKK